MIFTLCLKFNWTYIIYYLLQNLKFLEDSKYKDGNVSWEDYFRDLTNGDEILDAMNDIFLNVLFQKTRPGEDYKTSIHFSRHKILHGENIRYGRKDYTIRLLF